MTLHTQLAMGWLRIVGSFKLLVSFAKEPYKRDDILQKRHVIWRSLLIVATPYTQIHRDVLPRQCVAMRCSVCLLLVATRWLGSRGSVLHCLTVVTSRCFATAVFCSVLQCDTVCCGMSQCVTVWCSVLQRVACHTPAATCYNTLHHTATHYTCKCIQPIAFGVSFSPMLQSQSSRSLFNGAWQKRPREPDDRLRFDEMTLPTQ